MASANFQKPSLPSCSATHSEAMAAGRALGWMLSSGNCRYTQAIWPLLSSTIFLSVGCTREQNGHWKSEYSISTTGALKEPIMWSSADGARTLALVAGAGTPCCSACVGGSVRGYTMAPAIIIPAIIMDTDGESSSVLLSDMRLLYASRSALPNGRS